MAFKFFVVSALARPMRSLVLDFLERIDVEEDEAAAVAPIRHALNPPAVQHGANLVVLCLKMLILALTTGG